jgi:hypothetical protein
MEVFPPYGLEVFGGNRIFEQEIYEIVGGFNVLWK